MGIKCEVVNRKITDTHPTRVYDEDNDTYTTQNEEEVYEVGEVIEADEGMLRAFGDNLRPVQPKDREKYGDPTEDQGGETTTEEVGVKPDLNEYNVTNGAAELARQYGLEASVANMEGEGSGEGGRVLKSDVEGLVEQLNEESE
jgi:pyruvate/2-oxoglutarate dehydrogenase complex dihydrolipoamide acyltransferase (E2) component